MNFQRLPLSSEPVRAAVLLAALLFTGALASQAQFGRTPLVVTSTNNSSENSVVVFKLQTGESPSLSLSQNFHTGGKGGAAAGGEAGIVQFRGELGAVANFGSNSVSQLARLGDSVVVARSIPLASDCVKPASVALTDTHLFVVGANCAETHAWPGGYVDGPVVSLSDPSAAQIAAGETWAAVTMTSGSLLQLPLTREDGVLNGTSTSIPLPSDANNTPLGEAFWGQCSRIHAGAQHQQLCDCRRGAQPVGRFPGPALAVFSCECALLGSEGTGKHLVHGQLAGRRDRDLLQRRAERGVL